MRNAPVRAAVVAPLLAILAGAQTFAQVPGAQSFEEVLKQYRQATQFPPRISFSAVEDVIKTYDGIPAIQDSSRFELAFNKDGDRFDTRRALLTADASGHFSKPDVTLHAVNTSTQHAVAQDDGTGTVSGVNWFPEADVAAERAQWNLISGRALNGYLACVGDHHLADVLLEGRNHAVSSEAGPDGRTLLRLQSRGRQGQVNLWVDPALGYVARRIEVKKSGENLLWNRPLPHDLLDYSYACEDMEYSTIEGVVVPVSMRATETKHFDSGRSQGLNIRHQRSQINLSPTFSDPTLFSMKLPNGTPVWFEKRSGVNYEWRDGRPEPVVDVKLVSSIEQAVKTVSTAQTAPVATTRHFQDWLLPLVSTAILGAFALLSWAWFSRRQAR